MAVVSNPSSNRPLTIRVSSIFARDCPALAPTYQPESSALANELMLNASVTAPSNPETLDNFTVFSGTICIPQALLGGHVDDRVDEGDGCIQRHCPAVECHHVDVADGGECDFRRGNDGSH